jgi:hypothetical protein
MNIIHTNQLSSGLGIANSMFDNQGREHMHAMNVSADCTQPRIAIGYIHGLHII